jgi:hypothetical protein
VNVLGRNRAGVVVAAVVATDGRVPGGDVGFEGDPSAEDGRDVEAKPRGLIASLAVETGAGADTGESCCDQQETLMRVKPTRVFAQIAHHHS